MIRTLYWDDVPVTSTPWAPSTSGRVLVLLPGPADHDICLRNAGFKDFADTDESWHSEFSRLVSGVVNYGNRFGDARITSGEPPQWRGSIVGAIAGKVTPTVVDAVVCAAFDDSFPPCQIEFGEPPLAAIRTFDGHPVIWLWERAPGNTTASLVTLVAQGLPNERARLEWSAIA